MMMMMMPHQRATQLMKSSLSFLLSNINVSVLTITVFLAGLNLRFFANYLFFLVAARNIRLPQRQNFRRQLISLISW